MSHSVPTTAEHKLDPKRWLDEHGDTLLAFAESRVGDTATAEDLVQETLLAAWRGREQYAARAAERTWLIGILKRRLVDHWRRSGGRHGHAPNQEYTLFNERGEWSTRPDAWPAEAAGPDTIAESDEFWHVLERCQGDMPPHLARVFQQRAVAEAPVDSVCEAEGISRKNLSVRLHRARLLVRKCLERRWFCAE
ncbi:MAG: sigma-70 family RNA polymerase sigma factor [Planctomycetota bacterium]